MDICYIKLGGKYFSVYCNGSQEDDIDMDIICRAMKKNLHISGNVKLDEQTWQMFEEDAADKKVFLFGTGTCTEYFFENYGSIQIEGIIDNDIRRQGFRAEDFLWEARGARYGNMEISSVDLLNRYDSSKILVLITSTKYYKPIITQLKEAGIKNTYVLLIMEANKIKKYWSYGEDGGWRK